MPDVAGRARSERDSRDRGGFQRAGQLSPETRRTYLPAGRSQNNAGWPCLTSRPRMVPPSRSSSEACRITSPPLCPRRSRGPLCHDDEVVGSDEVVARHSRKNASGQGEDPPDSDLPHPARPEPRRRRSSAASRPSGTENQHGTSPRLDSASNRLGHARPRRRNILTFRGAPLAQRRAAACAHIGGSSASAPLAPSHVP